MVVRCAVKYTPVPYLTAVRALSKNNVEALPAGGEGSQPLEEEDRRILRYNKVSSASFANHCTQRGSLLQVSGAKASC